MSADTSIKYNHTQYCKGSESTAKILACLQEHQTSAQERLQVSYETLTGSLQDTMLETFKGLHQDWLSLRDTQCNWESVQTDIPALQQINKIACIARMTEHRNDALYVMITDQQSPARQRQFTDFPRWINAAAKDHPYIFWDIKSRLAGDLNCDNSEEWILPGLNIEKDKEGQSHVYYSLAISDNPGTGRPVSTLVKLLIEEGGLCTIPSQITFEAPEQENPSEENAEENIKAPGCTARLILKPQGCAPLEIGLTADGYGLMTDEPENTDPATTQN